MMSSSAKDASSEPRYTIEQISLLQRLLRTGLTKDNIIHALDSMAKMDAELCGSSPPLVDNHTSYASSSRNATPTSTMHRGASLRDGGEIAVHEVEVRASGGAIQGAGLLQGMSQEVVCGVENFLNVSDEEVDLLFHRGPMALKSEIRAFIEKYRLSQTQISLATGISQSYISSFLLNSCTMKRSTQELLYRWYLGKKKELEDLDVQQDFEPLDNSQLTHRSMELSQSFYTSPNDSYIHSTKRRERFTWKDSHIRILESYYNKNPYPNDTEREKITEACNNEQKQSGETIPDSRWVTSSKVYNWFANRRKDANRRKRLGQRIDMNHAQNDNHYASTSPEDIQIIEVRQDEGEVHETKSALTDQEVHIVEVRMNNDESVHDRKPNMDDCVVEKMSRSTSDTKPYGNMNTIYTLIEAVEESNAPKNV